MIFVWFCRCLTVEGSKGWEKRKWVVVLFCSLKGKKKKKATKQKTGNKNAEMGHLNHSIALATSHTPFAFLCTPLIYIKCSSFIISIKVKLICPSPINERYFYCIIRSVTFSRIQSLIFHPSWRKLNIYVLVWQHNLGIKVLFT